MKLSAGVGGVTGAHHVLGVAGVVHSHAVRSGEALAELTRRVVRRQRLRVVQDVLARQLADVARLHEDAAGCRVDDLDQSVVGRYGQTDRPYQYDELLLQPVMGEDLADLAQCGAEVGTAGDG